MSFYDYKKKKKSTIRKEISSEANTGFILPKI